MKRGVVVEQHRKYTIVLTRDGHFQKAQVLDENVGIGAEVSYQPLERSRRSFLVLPLRNWRVKPSIMAIAAACSLFLFILPLYLFSDDSTYAYVTVDINPSIELEIDQHLHVKGVHPLNKDAEKVLSNLKEHEGETVESVIHKITKISEQTGVVNDGNHMIVGVSYAEGSKGKADLMGDLEAYFSTNMEGWNVATLLIPENVREMAHESEASMNAVMADQLLDDSVSPENVKTLNEEDKEIINIFYRTEHEENNETEETGMIGTVPKLETAARKTGVSLEMLRNWSQQRAADSKPKTDNRPDSAKTETAENDPGNKDGQADAVKPAKESVQQRHANASKPDGDAGEKPSGQTHKEKKKHQEEKPGEQYGDRGKHDRGKGRDEKNHKPGHEKADKHDINKDEKNKNEKNRFGKGHQERDGESKKNQGHHKHKGKQHGKGKMEKR